MVSESGGGSEPPAADRTRVGFHRTVDREMVAEVVLVREGLAADVAGKRLVLHVGLPEAQMRYRWSISYFVIHYL